MLGRCLATGKERTVQVTVDNLAAADAGTLLEVAVSRLDSRQGEGQTVATWIRAVLLKHTAYLMSTPGAACTPKILLAGFASSSPMDISSIDKIYG
jgi:hypothetical protein